MPKMIKTKIIKKKTKFVLQKADDLGKYKVIASFKTLADAQVFRAELIENTEKAITKVSKLTVVEAYQKYAEYKFELWNRYDKLSEHQAKIYSRHFKNWINLYFPKDLILRELRSKNLVKFFQRMRENGSSFKNASVVIYSFKGMFEWCVDQDLVQEEDYNIKFFEVRKYPELIPNDGSDKQKKTVMINRYEVNRLLEAIKPTNPNDYDQVINYVAINIFIYTGARPAEVRAIEWSCVNLDTNRIQIKQQMRDQSLKFKLKAEGSERFIYVPSKLKKILARWKEYQSEKLPNSRFLLQNPYVTGLPITDKQIRNFLYRAYAKIGLAILEDNGNHIKVISCKFKGEPFKTFRHFVSTAVLDAQAANPQLSDNFIKSQIGHRDIKTTRMIYGDHNDLDYQSNKDNLYIQGLDNALDPKIN